MSRIYSLFFGGFALALVAVAFALGYNPLNASLPAPTQPTGAYWNVDTGFGDSGLVFLKSGRYTNGADGSVSVEGNYTLRADTIVFTEYGPADAPCLHIPATYSWRVKAQVLTLKAVDDKCPTRQFDWATGQWFKQPS